MRVIGKVLRHATFINVLEIENVGDTGAEYSMVLLDRFTVRYPRLPIAADGYLEGTWSDSCVASVSGLGPGSIVLDVT